MSLRLKLILGFLLASLAMVSMFASVAYIGARDFAFHHEVHLMQEHNQHLLGMLPDSPSLTQLQELANQHGSQGYQLAVIDASGKLLNQPQGHGEPMQHMHMQHSGQPQASVSSIGIFPDGRVPVRQDDGQIDANDTQYLWAVISVPNTNYRLLNIHHNEMSSLQAFLLQAGTSLTLVALVAMLLALWGALWLGELYDKIGHQSAVLKHQKRFDTLTNLPNRSAMEEITEQTIAAAAQANHHLALCMIGLHRFNEINESLGHSCGDELLRQVAQRLQHILRASDVVGRFDGNKFTVLLDQVDDSVIGVLSNRLLTAFETAFGGCNQELYIQASMGIAKYPAHASDTPTLLQKAEAAMYQARAQGLDCVVYNSQQDQASLQRLALANDLRNAIRDHQLELYYQPQRHLRSGKIIGAEALARWQHPEHGFIPPDTFISIAEHSGLIGPLTNWVLETAIRHCAQWQKIAGHFQMSINLSARNLHDPKLAIHIESLINEQALAPSCLTFEITETAMMQDPANAKAILDHLDHLGVRLSIDDFGTGYSSLAYLKQLPVDEIKVDRSFVMNMTEDENDASIVKATIGLAHDMGLAVVAEGVEDQATQDQLGRLGCDIIQGYYISRPVPHQAFSTLLSACNDEQAPVAAGLTSPLVQPFPS